MNVWAILPTYNEAPNLPRLADELLKQDARLRLVVVDDASPDGTGALAEALAARDARVRVLHREGERGLGTAYLAGFREALANGADALLTMDCDFSHDPAAVPRLLAALAGADLVIGSRYVSGGRIEGWPAHRKVISKAANAFVHVLFGLPAADCTSGYRLYRRGVVEGIPWERVRSTGYSFLVESLYWATRPRQARLAEVPICFRDREHGASKLGWREAVYGARNLIQLWLRTRLAGSTRPPGPA
jgi:glycosyltransferase involved in cell wall biosynthesis